MQVVDKEDRLARGTHLRSQVFVYARELVEGEDRLFDGIAMARGMEVEVGEFVDAQHDLGGVIDVRLVVSLGNERDGTRSARVGLDDVHDVVLDGKLDVDQPDGMQFDSDRLGVVDDLLHDKFAPRWSRPSGCRRVRCAP